MTFRVRPLVPIGVEIEGLTLGDDLPNEDFEALRRSVLEHEVVLLREQSLSGDEQLALGRRFGPLEGISVGAGRPFQELIVIANVDDEGRIRPDDSEAMRSIAINEQWHTDSSFRETPATFSIFAAVEIPPEGGETWYASLRRGWEDLDSQARDALEGLRAKHDYREAYRRAGAGAAFEGMGSALEHWHPLVRRHPETGARALYVTRHAFEVEGMGATEGRALIEKLVAFCTEEDRVYRHRWCPGDVLIWDNRSVLHRAQGFEERHRRVMHHVRVAGTEKVAS